VIFLVPCSWFLVANVKMLKLLTCWKDGARGGLPGGVFSEKEMRGARKKAGPLEPLGNSSGFCTVFPEVHLEPLEPLAKCTRFLMFQLTVRPAEAAPLERKPAVVSGFGLTPAPFAGSAWIAIRFHRAGERGAVIDGLMCRLCRLRWQAKSRRALR
jgi:hypothetical protein